MIYGKNRVNNEISNIDCDIDEDAKRYTQKYISIVNDKPILINAASDSIDELTLNSPISDKVKKLS